MNSPDASRVQVNLLLSILPTIPEDSVSVTRDADEDVMKMFRLYKMKYTLPTDDVHATHTRVYNTRSKKYQTPNHRIIARCPSAPTKLRSIRSNSMNDNLRRKLFRIPYRRIFAQCPDAPSKKKNVRSYFISDNDCRNINKDIDFLA
jgi:hypothetical protein